MTANTVLAVMWLLFVPCIVTSVVSTLLMLAVMLAAMGSMSTPVSTQLPVLIFVSSVFLLPALFTIGIWRGWGTGTVRRKWMLGAAFVLGSTWLVLGVERIINDSGDWLLHLPLWICGLPLLLSAVLAMRNDAIRP